MVHTQSVWGLQNKQKNTTPNLKTGCVDVQNVNKKRMKLDANLINTNAGQEEAIGEHDPDPSPGISSF